jgi:hypothetical protein
VNIHFLCECKRNLICLPVFPALGKCFIQSHIFTSCKTPRCDSDIQTSLLRSHTISLRSTMATAITITAPTQGCCTHCGDPANIECSTCRPVVYCTVECQQAVKCAPTYTSIMVEPLADIVHRRIHSTICSARLLNDPRPGPEYRSAILLPEDDDKPRFVWIRTEGKGTVALQITSGEDSCVDHEGGQTDGQKSAVVDNSLGSGSGNDVDEDLGHFDLDLRKSAKGRQLGHAIRIARSTLSHRTDKQEPNPCLARLSLHRTGTYCRGSFILLGSAKVGESNNICVDLVPADITVAIYGLINASWKLPGAVFKLSFPSDRLRKVNGVKVEAVLDAAGKESIRFTAVRIPAEHPMFTAYEGIVPSITARFGMSLRTWQLPSALESSSTRSLPDRSLPTAYLHLTTIPDIDLPDTVIPPELGDVPDRFLTNRNSILVVPQARQSFDAETLKAVCCFCKDAVQPALRKVAEKVPGAVTEYAETTSAESWKKYEAEREEMEGTLEGLKLAS